MSGEHNLDVLIRSMKPALDPVVYVFATFREGNPPLHVTPRMVFQEQEGTTLILAREDAEQAGIDFEFPCRMITLNVHSALDAVGFLAKITTRLASLGMGVNPVSGFFHDHLFIPEDRAQDAMAALSEMTQS